MSSALASRLRSFLPSLSRSLATSSAHVAVPPPRAGSIATSEDFLKAIGRSCDTKITFESWDEMWNADGLKLKKSGMAVQDRRYLLWALQKYRLGEDPETFAHEVQPKKTIRGRGPSVQNGKRIRSRRKC